MTVSPVKRNKVLRQVRCSPRGTGRPPQDDWQSAKNFSFPESPTLSRKTISKRPVASSSRSNDTGLPYKNRRHSVLLKRLDLPPVAIHHSPANSRRTRRQSMIHLNMKDTVRSNICNNKIPQPIEEENSLKIPGSKLPSIKAALAKKEASKPVVAKKDISKTKLPEKKNGMIMTVQKLNSSPVKSTDTPQHKSLQTSEVASSTLHKSRTKRRIEMEAISEVEPSAKKRKLGPSSNQKLDVVQTSCPKETLQKSKTASHSLGQKKVSNSVPSSQPVKAKSPSPASFEKRSFISKSFSSRPQTRAITKKIVPKNSMESISTSPLVTKTKQERKKTPPNPSSEVLKARTLAPVSSSSDTQIKPMKKKESTPAPEVTKTKQERKKTPPNPSPEVLKGRTLAPVSSSSDTQIESVKKKESTPAPEVTKTKQERKKTPPNPSPEVLEARTLAPVSSSSDIQIKPVKKKESLPDPEVVKTTIVKPSPKPQRPKKSAARSSKRVRVTGISPQTSFVEFKKTVASEREDHSDHNMDLGLSPLLLPARMQLQIIRNSPMRYKREPVNRQVKPFTPKPDPPPSHILKQTLKKRVDHELEKETQVEVDTLRNGECSIPDTVNEGCSDVPVLTPNTPNSAPSEGCCDVPVFTLNTPTSTTNLPTTPKSSRQHQASTHSRPVESSCNLDNVPCQQDSPPATPRSSTPIEEETKLDCLTVDPIVEGAMKESGTGTSAESFDACESDDDDDDDNDNNDDNDDNDDDDDNDDSDDDDDNSAEMEVSEEMTPPQSKRSYCVVM